MPVTNGYKATKQIHGLDSEYAKRLPIISITLCQPPTSEEVNNPDPDSLVIEVAESIE